MEKKYPAIAGKEKGECLTETINLNAVIDLSSFIVCVCAYKHH